MSKRILIIVALMLSLVLIGCKKNEEVIHSVSFETFGGQYIQNELVKEGQLVTRPVDPKNQDLVFDNWYKDPNFSVVWKFEEFVITNDTTIYAKFNEKIVSEKVSVKFVLEDNTIIQELEYSLNSKIDIPLEPVKEGFIFEGWFLNGNEYDFNTLLTNNVTLVGKFTEEEVVSFVITLELNGGNLDETTLTVNEGETFTLPTPIHPLGFIFIGWFDSNNVKFNQTVTNEDITLFAKYQDANVNNYNYSFGTYPEAIWIEIEEDNSEIEVFYKLSENETYIKVDSELIIIGPSNTTINIVGLSMAHYDVKIIFNEVNELVINQINVKAHDRSGYAHFNYNEGIGAYNDDGTLKDDAIVVYVTNENKNNITIPGIKQIGLGWILNNAQYSNSNSNTNSAVEYNGSLAKFDKPIVFRLIGKITAPEGVTVYNSTNNGGSVGDNGNMARMKDAKHITIEGIGEGAEIFGWGIHFMAASTNRGISFELRNITFDQYPEDALGLEGDTSGRNLVQRAWIHNSVFKQGFSANPAESDKAFGDGSLDIKRGEYFTISYNHFLDARKTNLVGGSDSHLQYHFTYHHNLWQNSDSRTPLTRNANVHLYNNVFLTTDDNAGPTSYAVNTRANAYIFSEANYFYGIKNPFRKNSSGGPIKSFGDILYSTHGEHHQTIVDTRTQLVPSNNKYANFDTDPTIFYYDEVNQKSRVTHITDAFTAKAEVYAFGGVYKRNPIIDLNEQYITQEVPQVILESQTIIGGKIERDKPFYVFEINILATFEMTAGSSNYLPRLVNIKGVEMLTGTGVVTLEPGIYVLESQQSKGSSGGSSQAKEARVESFTITIDSIEARQERINAVNNALALLTCDLIYNNEFLVLIKDLELKYDNLLEEDKFEINNELVMSVFNDFNELGIEHIESLINDIGLVTVDSFAKISLARKAYDQANLSIKELITNYNTLTNAEAEYQQYAVNNLIADIDETITFEVIDATDKNNVLILYNTYLNLNIRLNDLDNQEQVLITNKSKITNNILELENILLVHEIKELINDGIIVKDNLELVNDLYNNYNSLSSTNKEILTELEVTNLNTMYEEYLTIKEQRTEQIYYFGVENAYFTTESVNGTDIALENHFGIDITRALKMESKTKITFTALANFKLIIRFTEGEAIKVNGEIINIVSNEIILYLNAGTHIIQRNSNPQALLVYIQVIENY